MLAVATAGLWWRSLFVADVVSYASPATLDGLYARRDWVFLSGYGFSEIGRSIDWTTSRADSDRLNGYPHDYGWQVASPCEELDDQFRWADFVGGLQRLAWYRTAERHGSMSHAGRYLEVPFAVPVAALLIPPVTAIVRRRRRLKRESVGLPRPTPA